MSSPLRFGAIELDYGCHHARYRIPGRGGPGVIVGSNGSGKSTLVEALVRTLFGFNRREPDARRTQEQRRPWKAGRFRAVLILHDREGRISIERDFDSNEVTARRVSGGEVVFSGQPNPAAPGSGDQREYRKFLQRTVGLTEIEHYEQTACIRQGRMLHTELTQDLLRIAAGGHADVEAARAAVRERYNELTLAPITSAENRRRKKGRVELLGADLEEVEATLAATRAAEMERRPLVDAQREHEARLAAGRDEVRRLETQRDALSELSVLEGREGASLERIRRLEESQEELREAIWKAEAAVGEPDSAAENAYPPDFLERLTALEEGLWPRLRELQMKRIRVAAGSERADVAVSRGDIVLLAVASALLGAGLPAGLVGDGTAAAIGFGAALAGVILLAYGLRRIWSTRAEEGSEDELEGIEAELAAVRSRIETKLEGLPEAVGIAPGELAEARRAHAAWSSARELREESGYRLADALRRAARALDAPAPDLEDEAELGVRLEAARPLLASIERALSDERSDVLAPTRLEIERARSEVERLPEDGQAALRRTDGELGGRRRALIELEAEQHDLQARLLELPRPEVSSIALEERRDALASALAAARGEARAFGHAYELLIDAYEGFRETDQERLIEHIDAHLGALGNGKLGPLAVPDALESARLLYGGRTVALESPPLSYGELHLAMFAVRLGAADFLAGMGVRLPLLLDDPFVHLDATRAGEIWEALGTISRERQVLVTTQDRLTLEHLGVRPGLDLDGPERPVSAQMELPVTGFP